MAKADWHVILAKHFVYILQSLSQPDQFYTGLCSNVERRLAAHNAGQSPHTAKFRPWRLVSAHYFADPETAASFERYLKTGSGRAFGAKRLRSNSGAVPVSTKRDTARDHAEELIDEALEESFPASDPPEWTLGRDVNDSGEDEPD